MLLAWLCAFTPYALAATRPAFEATSDPPCDQIPNRYCDWSAQATTSVSPAIPASQPVRRAPGSSSPGNFAFNKYTAVGDSFTAGSGPYQSFDNDLNCARTVASYPKQFFDRYGKDEPADNFRLLACSGHNCKEILAQIQSPEFGTPDLVSITLGGNEAGTSDWTLGYGIFHNVVASCMMASEIGCDHYIEEASNVINSIGPALDEVIKAAVTTNPPPAPLKRTVVVLGYPVIYTTDFSKECNCPGRHWYTNDPDLDEEGVAINNLVSRMNDQLKASSERNGARYVDIDFGEHRLCERVPWFQTKNDDATGETMMHPTTEGYSYMADAMARALGL